VPADGGHHFFDVAAGAAVAAFAVLAARALLQGEDDRQAAIVVAPVGQAGESRLVRGPSCAGNKMKNRRELLARRRLVHRLTFLSSTVMSYIVRSSS
jgi:hypothetical protein